MDRMRGGSWNNNANNCTVTNRNNNNPTNTNNNNGFRILNTFYSRNLYFQVNLQRAQKEESNLLSCVKMTEKKLIG
jgi:hypothetical protein